MMPAERPKISDESFLDLMLGLLSSLVRYRPQIWQNAISRSVTAQSPADDRSLSLIETVFGRRAEWISRDGRARDGLSADALAPAVIKYVGTNLGAFCDNLRDTV